MDAGETLTAAEIERLSPDERQRLFNERVVDSLDEVPAEFLARVRAKGAQLLHDRGIIGDQA